MIDINNFTQEKECIYKDERYLVRDNGAIMRYPKEGKKPRPLDNIWMFGKANPQNGYMFISTIRVHIIVANAFHGEPPTSQHIVDHIDTNRQNNRQENLRWLTRFENAINNPITRKRIIYRCGSIEAFLENPSLLHDSDGNYTDIAWMRSVTAEEAQNSRKNLERWAAEDNIESKGGKLGEWVFSPTKDDSTKLEYNEDIKHKKYTHSLTANAVQLNWETPCEFPCCPEDIKEHPIAEYYSNLASDNLFAKNKYETNTIVYKKAISPDNQVIWVILKANYKAIKEWYLTKISFNEGVFVHESLSSFFSQNGVEKRFTTAQGLEWTGEDSIDDYC